MSPSEPRQQQPRSGALGYPRLHLRRTDSTNERASVLAKAGAPSGALVTATEQTAGRGRQGRTWWAPPGGSLLLSLLVREPPRLLPLITAVAVCDVVGESAAVKWPNDVVIRPTPPADENEPHGEDSPVHGASSRQAHGASSRQTHGASSRQTHGASSPRALAKLAGILVEGRPQEDWAVVGIGVNVAVRGQDIPAELSATAATLALPSSEIEPLLKRLLCALARRLDEPDHAVLDAWRARDALLGSEISWETGRGTAQGVDDHGHLLVRLPDGTKQTLSAGEVHLEVRADP